MEDLEKQLEDLEKQLEEKLKDMPLNEMIVYMAGYRDGFDYARSLITNNNKI